MVFAEEKWGENERVVEFVQQNESENSQLDVEKETNNRRQEGKNGIRKERQGCHKFRVKCYF